jgi:hypothetical protein
LGREDLSAHEPALLVERDIEHRADAAVSCDVESPVRREVAERVGDEPVLVELHAAQHVRPASEHEVGARVDDGVL